MNEDELTHYCKKNNILLNVLIELTSECNLHCKHCYVHKNRNYLHLPIIIDIVNKLKDEGVMYVSLTGGEVFTHPNFNEIYKLFKKNGFIVSIRTNALLLNDEHIKLFNEYPPSQVNITIYGLNNEDYSKYCGDKYGFSRIEKALGMLHQNNVRFSLCTIADKFHYADIVNSNYTDFFKKYNRELECNYDLYNTNEGIDTPIHLRINNEQIIKIETEQLRANNTTFSNTNPIGNTTKLSCKGGVCNMSIDSEGYVSGCLMDGKKVKLDIENWVSLKKSLVERNEEIEHLFKKSKCCGCKEAFLCQKCPLWHTRTLNDNMNDRCELAKMKKLLFKT